MKQSTRDRLYLKLFVTDETAVTQEEVEYFRDHPDEIDEITKPIHVHRFFLAVGVVLGIMLVGISKIMKFSSVLQFFHAEFQEFVVDIVFEIGVALVGAGVTAYLLGILLNLQQANAAKWRQNIRAEIGKAEDNQNSK